MGFLTQPRADRGVTLSDLLGNIVLVKGELGADAIDSLGCIMLLLHLGQSRPE